MYDKFDKQKPFSQLDTSKYPPEVVGRFNSFITTQFDDSMSVEMQIRSLIKWINSSRDLVNDIVDYINLFIETFDERLQEEIVEHLREWLDDGTLAEIINNDVFDMKADKTFVDSEIERLEQSIQFVNYEMFGVNGQKKYFNVSNGRYYLDQGLTQPYEIDDGIKIKEAHEYAIANGLPIVNTSGEYVLRETKDIPIATNTDFGNSVFHIDEKVEDSSSFKFKVTPTKQSFTLSNTIVNSLSTIPKHTTKIPQLRDYKDHLIILEDENDIIGKRRTTGSGQAKRDIDVVSTEEGDLLVGTTWDFGNITKITMFPIDKELLTISGGTFKLSGDNLVNNGYRYTGFSIRRSNVLFNKMNVEFEQQDNSQASVYGFFNVRNVYNITLENINGQPRRNIDVAGTYFLVADYVVNLNLVSMNVEGSDSDWGAMGTNFIKNLYVSKSNISRIDTHLHAWNVTIKDTTTKAIFLTGGGNLYIDNTYTVGGGESETTNLFVQFRDDYGGKWDGDITILNSGSTIHNNGRFNLLNFYAEEGDYGYPIVFAHEIKVENFTLHDATGVNDKEPRLINFGNMRVSNGKRVKFPKLIHIKNVTTNHVNGFQLPSSSYLGEIEMDTKNNYVLIDNEVTELVTNALYIYENIETRERTGTQFTENHLSMFNSIAEVERYDEYSLVPKIVLKNIPFVNLNFTRFIGEIEVSGSIVNTLRNVDISPVLTVRDCELKPNYISSGTAPYQIDSGVTKVYDSTAYPITLNGDKNFGVSVTRHGLWFVDNSSSVITFPKTVFRNVGITNEFKDFIIANGFGRNETKYKSFMEHIHFSPFDSNEKEYIY